MSVDLAPQAQLGFERPFNRQLSKTLAIHNPHARPVGFKIKTTAPKQYCVRPNAGRVEPGETVEVQVILQPMKEDPPMEARCKDKFLVQSAIIPVEQEVKPLSELWVDLEKTSRASIHEQKIKCAYLTAPSTSAGGTGTATPVNGDHTLVGETSRLDESTYINAAEQTRGLANGQQPESPSSPTPPPAFHESEAQQPSSSGEADQPAVISSITNTASDVGNTLQDQLAAAKKEIERLKHELTGPSVTGLRQRTNAIGSSEKNAMGTQANVSVQEAASTGVPVPVVAVIAFAVFLITYLYF